jgi:hypothetical protein
MDLGAKIDWLSVFPGEAEVQIARERETARERERKREGEPAADLPHAHVAHVHKP